MLTAIKYMGRDTLMVSIYEHMRLDFIQIIVDTSDNINWERRNGLTALEIAINMNTHDNYYKKMCVKMLINAGACPNMARNYSRIFFGCVYSGIYDLIDMIFSVNTRVEKEYIDAMYSYDLQNECSLIYSKYSSCIDKNAIRQILRRIYCNVKNTVETTVTYNQLIEEL